MLAFITQQPFTFVLVAAAALALGLAALGVRVIGEHEAGLARMLASGQVPKA